MSMLGGLSTKQFVHKPIYLLDEDGLENGASDQAIESEVVHYYIPVPQFLEPVRPLILEIVSVP
jgi:hypothetical protein